MAKKPTLTSALDDYLNRTAIAAFSCQELARAATAAIGYEPSLMAVSRVMGRRPGWEKTAIDGRVYFAKIGSG